MTYLKLDDAVMVLLDHLLRGDSPDEPSELVKKARSLLGGHVDALNAIHRPPKHWAKAIADDIFSQNYRTFNKDKERVAAALVDAEQQGFLKAVGACNGYIKDIAGSLAVPSRDIQVVDAVIQRIFAARKKEADNANGS